MILGKTNHPYLRVGRHSWYQSITGIIHRVRSYFQKLMVRIRVDAHIRDFLPSFPVCNFLLKTRFTSNLATSSGRLAPLGSLRVL
jgi:hypothetical protein